MEASTTHSESSEIIRTKNIIEKKFEKYNEAPIEGLEGLVFEQKEKTVPFDDFKRRNFVCVGPKGTPWEGNAYEGTIEFPSKFPFKPPSIKFKSYVFHPNIYRPSGGSRGSVCISILDPAPDSTNYVRESETWRAVHGIESIFLSIFSLFHDPNNDSPADIDAKNLYEKCKNRGDFTEMIEKIRDINSTEQENKRKKERGETVTEIGSQYSEDEIEDEDEDEEEEDEVVDEDDDSDEN
jgi:ubiquitin-protein ligase